MDGSHIVCTAIGFVASLFLCLPSLKKWQRKQIAAERMRITSEALDHAEERVLHYQERHDHILSQICSYYLRNPELEEALAGARTAMNEALELAVSLRKLKMKIISSYPFEVNVFM